MRLGGKLAHWGHEGPTGGGEVFFGGLKPISGRLAVPGPDHQPPRGVRAGGGAGGGARFRRPGPGNKCRTPLGEKNDFYFSDAVGWFSDEF